MVLHYGRLLPYSQTFNDLAFCSSDEEAKYPTLDTCRVLPSMLALFRSLILPSWNRIDRFVQLKFLNRLRSFRNISGA
jgi:hypothetical protein